MSTPLPADCDTQGYPARCFISEEDARAAAIRLFNSTQPPVLAAVRQGSPTDCGPYKLQNGKPRKRAKTSAAAGPSAGRGCPELAQPVSQITIREAALPAASATQPFAGLADRGPSLQRRQPFAAAAGARAPARLQQPAGRNTQPSSAHDILGSAPRGPALPAYPARPQVRPW